MVAHHVSIHALIVIDTIVKIDKLIQIRAIETVTRTDAVVAALLNDGGCMVKTNGVVCLHARDHQECEDIHIHIERKGIKIVQENAMITLIVAHSMAVDVILLTDNLVSGSNHKVHIAEVITVVDKIIVGDLVTIHKVLVTVAAMVVAMIKIKAISNRMLALKVTPVAVVVNILRVIANQVIVATLVGNMMGVIVANLRMMRTAVVDFPVKLVTGPTRVIAALIVTHITGVVKL